MPIEQDNYKEDNEKVYNLLKLIKLLLERNKTIKLMAMSLEVSEKTVYRYKKTLERLGYAIDKRDKFFFIVAPNQGKYALDDLDAQYLIKILSPLNKDSNAQTILNKLQQDHFLPIPETINITQTAIKTSTLINAIDEKKCIVLKKYHSSSSGTTTDRTVFPLNINNSGQLEAVELKTNISKCFKVQRIGDVLPYKGKAIPPPNTKEMITIDAFGMSGTKRVKVAINMTERAKNLLTEEFRNTINDCVPNKDSKFKHRYVTLVSSLEGIGRFILGLPGEIQVDEPAALKIYLKKMSQKLFLS